MSTLNLLPFGATWSEFSLQAPEFSADMHNRFLQFDHHIMATLSHDGSPRVSGTEVHWFDGRLIIGAQTGSRKVADLSRDPRIAIHTNPGDGTMSVGDYKVNGRVRVLSGLELERVNAQLMAPFGAVLFEVLISVVTCTQATQEELSIHVWQPNRGVTKVC